MSATLRKLPDATSAMIGTVLALPGLLFASASLLKYGLGLTWLYDNIGFLASPQIAPGYNAISPALFLGGTLAAAVLNLLPMLSIEFRRDGGSIVSMVRFTPRPINLIVTAVALVTFATIFGYAILENLAP
ncbi:MAG: hypothetical protein ACE5HT_06565 [Gemmatimonadales bacterium]